MNSFGEEKRTFLSGDCLGMRPCLLNAVAFTLTKRSMSWRGGFWKICEIARWEASPGLVPIIISLFCLYNREKKNEQQRRDYCRQPNQTKPNMQASEPIQIDFSSIRPLIPFDQFCRFSPKTLLKCISKECIVYLTDKSIRRGYLYSIDPESHDLLLVTNVSVGNPLSQLFQISFLQRRRE